MWALRSQLGLVCCAVYLAVAALALIHDLTRRPGVVLVLDELSPLVALPGLLLIAGPLELLGVQVKSEGLKLPLFVISMLTTAAMTYLLGAGIETLYRAVSK